MLLLAAHSKKKDVLHGRIRQWSMVLDLVSNHTANLLEYGTSKFQIAWLQTLRTSSAK